MEAKQPKKRGRKPKIKQDVQQATNLDQKDASVNINENSDNTNINQTQNVEISTDIIPQKKKRGRKPKPKPDNEEVKQPKKRGRKPKEIFKPSEPINVQVSEEAVILHLNIKNNNNPILNIEDEFVKYNPSINIPKPFIPEDLDNAFYIGDNVNSSILNQNEPSITDNFQDNTINDVNDIKNLNDEYNEAIANDAYNINENNANNITIQTQSINEDINEDINSEIEDTFNKNNMKMNIGIEKQLKLNEDKTQSSFNYADNISLESNTSDKNKCIPIFIEFADANRKNTWPSKTNIDCLWCCCSFENTPFGIPIKKLQEKYLMFGNFCSAECAASYIYNTNFLNNSERTESYSLLNLLYRERNQDAIHFAPSKLCLKRFGGRLTIEQYRNNLRSQNKEYNIVIPPLTSIIPNVEETNMSKSLSNFDSSILNNSIVSKTGELLRLKRQKPLPDSNNTLEACMNLKLL
jgi:hypothetical protein